LVLNLLVIYMTILIYKTQNDIYIISKLFLNILLLKKYIILCIDIQ
jgi:hypothetical protein